MVNIFSVWTDMPQARRNRLVRITGIVTALAAIFTLVSSVSYMFSWKADQSLLGSTFSEMVRGGEAVNAGGGLGNKFGYLLVGKWFGLGSLAIVITLGVLAFRMLFGRQRFSVIRIVLLSLFGAILISFIAAFFSVILGLDGVFGGGLGGECGSNMILWSKNLFGPVVTILLIIALVAIWLFFASDKFSRWFSSLGEGGAQKPVPSPVAVETPSGDGVDGKGKGFTWVQRASGEEAAPVSQPSGTPVSEESSGNGAVRYVPSSPGPVPGTTTAPAADGHPDEKTSAPPEGGEKQTSPHEDGGNLEIIEGEELSTDVTAPLPRIDVRDELRDYRFPPLSLLDDYENSRQEVSQEELKRNNFKIRATLKTYKIDVDNVKAVVGPTVTLYKVYPAPGVRIASIKNLQDDIAMSLNAKGVRVVKLADSVGIEVANDRPSIVPLKALLNDSAFRESKAELPVAIGYTITQKVKVFDLTDAPHLLVAGATKQGKSVGLNVLITSLLYAKHPSELKFVFIDPKKVEFTSYARLIKHYLAVIPTAASEEDEMRNAIAKDSKPAEQILKSLCIEMDDRYELLSKALVNNVKSYNEKFKDRHLLPTEGHKYLPYIVVVIDEYADLTMSTGASGEAKTVARNISQYIIRLAQKGRAAGIHLVIATQRPSVDVVTGLIKANFPTRIAFRVLSMTDSRTILDSPGAEKLIGRGDMIYYAGVDWERIQCALISNDEISAVTRFIGDQTGYKKSYNTPYYLPAPEPDQAEDGSGGLVDMKDLDERFMEAAKLVVTTQRGSTSDLQRRLGMGYAKAGRVMDQLEAAGIVGPQQGSKMRQVLVGDLDELDTILNAYMNQQG